MATASYLDRLLKPLTEAFTPRMASVLLELRADSELEAHIDELRLKANGGKGAPLPRQTVRLTMDPSLREVVRRRAGYACEYCRMPQAATPLIPFHIEHIGTGGTDDPSGLALACDRCNAYKGPNLTSIDPDTRTVVTLFSPRRDVWTDNFVLRKG